jgi:transposase
MYLPKRFVSGASREKLEQLSQKVDIGGTSTNRKQQMMGLRRYLTSMQGSPHTSNNTTLKDKLISSKPDIQTTSLFQTLDQDLITSGGDLTPFWTNLSMDWSQRLWLPIETDLFDLDSTLWNTSSKDMEPFLECMKIKGSKTVFQNYMTTSFQSLQFSQQGTMEQESIATKKVRFYPTKEQTLLLNKCLGASRFFYNKANAYVKEQIEVAKEQHLANVEERKTRGCVFMAKKKVDDKFVYNQCSEAIVENGCYCEEHKGNSLYKGLLYKFMTLPTIRQHILTPDSRLHKDHPEAWQKEIPYDTRQLAIKQLVAAYKAALSNKRNGNITHFDIGFKSKKRMENQICYINKDAFNSTFGTIFTHRLKKKSKLRFRKRDVFKVLGDYEYCDIVIQKSKSSKWYLCIPRKEPEVKKPIIEEAVYKSVFLDSGVRTFQTFYSPDGLCGKVGDRFVDKHLLPLGYKVDNLQSLSSQKEQHNFKTRRNMQRRMALLRDKMRNRTNDLHNKTAKFLCDAFQTIFVSTFEVKEMVPCNGRVINSQAVRKMLSLSHGRFKQKLLSYAKTKHRSVYIMSEEYTTKTCTRCGTINEVGGSTRYRCPQCSLTIDRDYNGARNMCLKVLS